MRSHALQWLETQVLAACGGLGRRMQVVGRENLPANDEPAVYVANHQSFLVSTQPIPRLDVLPSPSATLLFLLVVAISSYVIHHVSYAGEHCVYLCKTPNVGRKTETSCKTLEPDY